LSQLGQAKHDFDALHARVVAISVDPPEKLREFRTETKAPFTFLSDPKGVAAGQYAGFEANGKILKPATFVIDRHGILRWRHIGESPPDRPAASEVLAQLRAAAPG
jgi:peroxiredoxin